MRLRCTLVGLLIALFVVQAAPHLYADGMWLDEPLLPWNSPGMELPRALPMSATGELNNPMCVDTVRPPETTEDAAVASAGWMLLGAYQRGWGVTLVSATSDWDGMCRPAGYQGFVFVDGVFAGIVAPYPTFARMDGSFREIRLTNATQLMASFVRYADTDPLCCPSRGTSYVTYRIERAASGPVLIPVEVFSTGSQD